MKKVFITIILSSLFLVGCGNKQIIDLEYKFDTAIIEGIGTVEVSKWNNYDSSDMVQIIDTNGTVYLTHSSNVILIYKK